MSGSKYVRGMLLSKRLVKLAFLHFRPFSLSLPFSFLPSPLAKPRISMRLSAYTFRLSPTRDSFSVRRSLLWASDYTPSCAFDRSSFLCRCSVYDTGRDRRPLISKAGDKVYSATTTVGKWHGMSPLALMTENSSRCDLDGGIYGGYSETRWVW